MSVTDHRSVDAARPPVDDHYDVIVVGARVAGASTAHVLARLGLDVLVLERARPDTDTLSTHALIRAGVVQLHRWGLLEQIVAAGTPPVRRTRFHYATDVVDLALKPAHGVDALYAPRRTLLDPLLADAARRAGADVRFESSVVDLRRDRDRRVTGVVARVGGGPPTPIGARLVIGADGIRSTVAGLLDAPYERVGTGASAVTYGYWRGMETDGYEWMFRPRAAAGVIPTNDDAACVFVAAPPELVGRGDVASFETLLRAADPALADRVGAAQPVSPRRTFLGRPGHIRRSWGPGWALVGDAGYFKDPLSAHGLTDALRDAELVARAAAAVVGGVPEDQALAGYQAERDRLSHELFEVTDAIARNDWTEDQIGLLLLRLSGAMADELETVAALPDLPPLGRPDSTVLAVPA